LNTGVQVYDKQGFEGGVVINRAVALKTLSLYLNYKHFDLITYEKS